MRIVQVQEATIATPPVKSSARVEAIVGRTLGEVSVEELVHAAHSAKGDGGAAYGGESAAASPLVEVFQESEEE